jgi:hypothetical protein
MQKQLPVSFSLVIDPEYTTDPTMILVMVSMESSRSGKQVIRARGCWDGDLHTVVKDIPKPPEFNPALISNRDYSMAHCNYFWDWMRYGTVLAVLEIFLEDYIDYDDVQYFTEMLDKPTFQVGEYVQPDYLGRLVEFAEPLKLKFIYNGFCDIIGEWK